MKGQREHMELFRKAIEGNENKLVERMQVDGGLWTEMLARKVLSERQIDLCKKEVSLTVPLNKNHQS